jgi:hypothetical protein
MGWGKVTTWMSHGSHVYNISCYSLQFIQRFPRQVEEHSINYTIGDIETRPIYNTFNHGLPPTPSTTSPTTSIIINEPPLTPFSSIQTSTIHTTSSTYYPRTLLSNKTTSICSIFIHEGIDLCSKDGESGQDDIEV